MINKDDKKIKKNVIVLLICYLFFLSNITTTLAASITCTPVEITIEDKNIVLPGVNGAHMTQAYFIHNTSKQSLWMDHPSTRRSSSAGWSSYLRPGNWSVLLLNRKNFAINCAVIQPDKVEYLNCADVVFVCTPQHLNLNLKRDGSYWLTEDNSWDDLLKILEKKSSGKPKTLI